MSRLSDLTQQKELSDRATAFVALKLSRHIASNDEDITREQFVGRGWYRYAMHVKAAVNPMLTTDTGLEADALVLGFVSAVDRVAVLDALEGAVRVPVTAGGVRVQVGTITPVVTAEGAVKAVGRMTFETSGSLVKIPGEIIVSTELARSFDPVAQAAVRQALVSAVAKAVDAYLLGLWTAGSPIASSGATAATVAALLAAISDGAPTRPVLIGGWDSLVPLIGMLADLRALGVAIHITPAATGQLVVLDASGLALGDGGAEITVARHANILMDDGGSPPGTITVSTFQKNLEAIRAERFLFSAFRADAVAWASTTGSP